MRLYWNVGSQPARSVKALLDLGKLPYEATVISLLKSQAKSPEYLSINPLGQIPFLKVNEEFGIGESNAIMQYLCEKYPTELGKYYGKTLSERTIVNVYLSWYQSFYRPALFGRIKLMVYGTLKKGIPYTEKQLKTADQFMGEGLKHLQRLLQKNAFITGSSISIADILVFFETTNLVYYQMESVLKDFPKVQNWYTSIGSIPQIQSIQEEWRLTVPDFIALLEKAPPSS